METVSISGVVESHESPRFAKTLVSTISIVCFDPDFLGSEVSITGPTVATSKTIVYPGTVETGMRIDVGLGGTSGVTSAFSIANRMGLGVQTFTMNYYTSFPTASGSSIYIQTSRFQKNVTVTSGSTVSSGLPYVMAFSDWLTLVPGSNLLTPSFTRSAATIRYTYTPRYGGI